MMGGVMSLAVGIFGLIWTVIAGSMGGGLFALFGVVFIIIAVVQAIYHFKNATSEKRFSMFDITDHQEEPDPLNERFGAPTGGADPISSTDSDCAFCPYCGTPVNTDFEYCRKCGRKLPDE